MVTPPKKKNFGEKENYFKHITFLIRLANSKSEASTIF